LSEFGERADAIKDEKETLRDKEYWHTIKFDGHKRRGKTYDYSIVVRDLVSVMREAQGRYLSLKDIYELLHRKYSLHVIKKAVLLLCELNSKLIRVSELGSGSGSSYYVSIVDLQPRFVPETYSDTIFSLPTNKGDNVIVH
jgi:hypothetical protein